MQSYLTVQEADDRICTSLLSTDAWRLAWAALSEEDKEVCLSAAMTRIEALPYTGAPALPKQERAFPRRGETEVSEEVKTALALEACASCNTEAATRSVLQAQGVKSFSVGNLSESYELGSSSMAKLYSPTARQLLAKYLMGAHLCL